MHPDAEPSAPAAQKDLPPDLMWRLLRHPQARRTVALLRRDLTEQMIEEIIALGSARSLAANRSVPAETGARLAEHPEPAVRCAIAAGAADDPPGPLVRLTDDPDPSVRRVCATDSRKARTSSSATPSRPARTPRRPCASGLRPPWRQTTPSPRGS
ncbi:hypothetical protein [Streptomyces sp. SID3343]|uniref:hypothetical protein n=1 Tax=Streptomyces sp. SID3343 TaxID=2690260 RepID=UPI00136A9C17|nr:hypothetical protein [Streptomyces sp. SID3343]MYV97479.1 hypothetical protein [Streptomyces sp. SID3343]